ncbi:hypothetical protein [Vulcanimicrobium alpinum]
MTVRLFVAVDLLAETRAACARAAAQLRERGVAARWTPPETIT